MDKARELGFAHTGSHAGFTLRPVRRARSWQALPRRSKMKVCPLSRLRSVHCGGTAGHGGQETGIGGRNQEYALAAARRIVDSKNIVMAGVDTDGTDGPVDVFRTKQVRSLAWPEASWTARRSPKPRRRRGHRGRPAPTRYLAGAVEARQWHCGYSQHRYRRPGRDPGPGAYLDP